MLKLMNLKNMKSRALLSLNLICQGWKVGHQSLISTVITLIINPKKIPNNLFDFDWNKFGALVIARINRKLLFTDICFRVNKKVRIICEIFVIVYLFVLYSYFLFISFKNKSTHFIFFLNAVCRTKQKSVIPVLLASF